MSDRDSLEQGTELAATPRVEGLDHKLHIEPPADGPRKLEVGGRLLSRQYPDAQPSRADAYGRPVVLSPHLQSERAGRQVAKSKRGVRGRPSRRVHPGREELPSVEALGESVLARLLRLRGGERGEAVEHGRRRERNRDGQEDRASAQW